MARGQRGKSSKNGRFGRSRTIMAQQVVTSRKPGPSSPTRMILEVHRGAEPLRVRSTLQSLIGDGRVTEVSPRVDCVDAGSRIRLWMTPAAVPALEQLGRLLPA